MHNKAAIILAAGKGTRMGGKFPKVLAKLSNKSLIDYVLDTLQPFDLNQTVVVVGFMKEKVISHIEYSNIDFAEQKNMLGTADAVRTALTVMPDFDGDVMVLCGDVPLIPQETLKNILDFHKENQMKATVLTVELDEPARYGRIIRDDENMLEKIVEAADATQDEIEVREINSGMYVFSMSALRANIKNIDSSNAQGEFYLTDIIEVLKSQGERVGAFLYEGAPELLLGVNRPQDLKKLEKFLDKE